MAIIFNDCMEYQTRYPRTISFFDNVKNRVHADSKTGVAQLEIVVRKNVDDLFKIFASEGFKRVKFEHKRPGQIGSGMCLKLGKPWELHVRMTDIKDNLVAIHSEVEVSRDYLQHIFSQRTMVIYEVTQMLQKHKIEYSIWSRNLKKYVSHVIDDYRVKLTTPAFPVLAWKPMVYAISTISVLYLWKYLNTAF